MLKKCNYPLCCNPAMKGETKCEDHFVSKKKTTEFDTDSFYNTARWRKLSKLTLQRNPLCEICHKRMSSQADHWLERRMLLGLHYQTLNNNLIGECTPCHVRKTQIIKNLGLNSYATINYLIENYPRDEGEDYLLEYQKVRESGSFRKEKE